MAMPLWAYETDQFSTPPVSLADVGDDFSHFVKKEIDHTIDLVNNRDKLLQTIEQSKKNLITEHANETQTEISQRIRLENKIKRLERVYALTSSTEGIAQIVYERIGRELSWQDQRDGVFGIGLSIFPYKGNLKDGAPILYNPSKLQTIYSYSGFHRLISASYFVFCSTMKAYGINFGVDKLGHMFNQGHQYFEIVSLARNKGKNDSQSIKAAIDFGVNSEFKMFGKLVDGVYSNADLAANMSGYYFFSNLFEDIRLDNISHKALLKRKTNGKLNYNIESDHFNSFMAKFFTDHLNEALNPSHIEKMQQKSIKKAILKRCDRIRNAYQLHTKIETTTKLDSMKMLFGASYGHNAENLMRLDQICF